jgi:uncharacterized protein
MKLILICLLLLSGTQVFAQSSIPPFTPNVVDPYHYLEADEIKQINQKIEDLKSQDIWAAVYITDKLQNESIEELAVTSFNQWKLGQQGKDNGLLLVLVINDRKSRFEVGYGLEGILTDFITHQALTSVLAPKMRSKQFKLAIIESFDFVLKVKAGEKIYLPPEKDPINNNEIDFFNKKGIYTWIYYVCFIWLSYPSIAIINYYLIRKLRKKYPEDVFVKIIEADSGLKKTGKFVPLIVKSFLTLNPGVFIIILSNLFSVFIYFIILLCPLIFYKILISNIKKYSSKESYLEAINKLRSSYQEQMQKGYIVEESFGSFKYTPAWFSSSDFKEAKRVAEISRRSSSSSGGSRSSSGGGRSGGGGSSSSW